MDSENLDNYYQSHPEALGENVKERPQPADEPTEDFVESTSDKSVEKSETPKTPNRRRDLFSELREIVDRLEAEGISRGDLKIISRTVSELQDAFQVFQPYRRRRKVTVFGSARTPETHPTYIQAVAFSQAMAEHGWMTITGAGHGIMEAGHKGAGLELSMGLNIHLPFEQSSNPIIEGDSKLVTMKYFFTRKLMFVKECSAVASLPGGFGTLDETAEVLTLLQTGKQTMLPVVLLDQKGGDYWRHFGDFMEETLLADGMISPEDTALYKITDNVEEAVEETLHFYRVYHSMRYVRDDLVLRISKRLSAQELDQVNVDFADILERGKIEQVDALPEERNEPELSHLPRLKFHFDRRSLGRLRMLIDRINDCCPECETSPTISSTRPSP